MHLQKESLLFKWRASSIHLGQFLLWVLLCSAQAYAQAPAVGQVPIIDVLVSDKATAAIDNFISGLRSDSRVKWRVRPVDATGPLTFPVGSKAHVLVGHSFDQAKLPDTISNFYRVAVLGPEGSTVPNGVSINGRPDRYLDVLLTLRPDVKRIFLAHSVRESWWASRAKLASQQRGIDLILLPFDNAVEGAKALASLISKSGGSHDAIWLPLYTQGYDNSITQRVFTHAWQKRMPIFGAGWKVAERGALFGLYADNRSSGAGAAKVILDGLYALPDSPGYLENPNSFIALNTRSAQRVGVPAGAENRLNVSDFFPRPR